MIKELMGKKVSIWGTGMGGRKTYTYLKNKVEIVCFYDSDEKKSGTMLYDIPIKKWSADEPSTYVVIASDYWKEILPQLVNKGLKIFRDFTIYLFLQNSLPHEYSLLYEIQEYTGKWENEDWDRYKGNKELAILQGGCKGTSLGTLLSLHPTFGEKYKVVEVPRELHINSIVPRYLNDVAYTYMNDEIFLGQIDLFFHEPIDKKKTWIMQQDIILEKLNPKCKKILVSPLRFSGYFPQCRANEKRWISILPFYNMRYADKYIDELWNDGYSEEEILKRIKEDDFISRDEVEEFFRVSLSMLALLESKVDVKICDYIEEHCREEQLFYDPSHPSNKVLIEYANRLVQYLFPENNIRLQDVYSYEEMVYLLVQLHWWKVPVYPSVTSFLGLKSYEKTYRVNGNSGFMHSLTLDEYVYEYIRINLKDNKSVE